MHCPAWWLGGKHLLDCSKYLHHSFPNGWSTKTTLASYWPVAVGVASFHKAMAICFSLLRGVFILVFSHCNSWVSSAQISKKKAYDILKFCHHRWSSQICPAVLSQQSLIDGWAQKWCSTEWSCSRKRSRKVSAWFQPPPPSQGAVIALDLKLPHKSRYACNRLFIFITMRIITFTNASSRLHDHALKMALDCKT